MPVFEVTGRKLKLYASPRLLKDLVNKLTVGEIIRARVLETLENNRYIIRLRGFNVVAESFSTLTKGGWVSLRVKELGDKIIMQLLSEGEQKTVRQQMRKEEIGSLLKKLKFSPDARNIMTALTLLRYNLSLNRENMGKVLKYLQRFPDDGKRNIEPIVFLLARGLSISSQSLEQTRLYLFDNQRTLDFSSYLLLQIPPGRGEKTAPTRIKLFYKENGRKRKLDAWNTKLTFLLDTRNLGQLEIGVAIARGRLSCHLVVETEPVRSVVNENLKELKMSLEELNYSVSDIGCSLNGKGVGENFFFEDYPDILSLDKVDVVV